MSAHTPGPWKTHDRSIWAGEILLAKVYKQGDEGEPNARLIAAAPELLEALEAMTINVELGEYESQKQGLYRHIEVLQMARAAIAKACGGDNA